MSLANVEAIYGLSPLQRGILFQSLYAAGEGMYVNQLSCTLEGELDHRAFRKAWEYAVNRHAILRTGFVWERLNEPLQVVHRQVNLPWADYDWRRMDSKQQRIRIDEFTRLERDRGFDLVRAPLLRFALHSLDESRWQFTWTWHHILLDGWSVALLIEEVFACYEALRNDHEPDLPPRRPYQDYIEWMKHRDQHRAEIYWSEYLQGFRSPVELNLGGPRETASDYGSVETTLDEASAAALTAMARRHRLTLNTCVQGAWALLLNRYTGEHDIVFGCVVSGRPPDLEGAAMMLGLFINTLPVRLQVDSSAELMPWLLRLQAQQAEARQFDYCPLERVQALSDISRGTPLFNTVLAFENYYTGTAGVASTGFTITGDRPYSRASAPLTLSVATGRGLKFRLMSQFDRARIECLAHELHELLLAMTRHPNASLGWIAAQLDHTRRERVRAAAIDARHSALASVRSRRLTASH
jgi:Condensation domain